MGFKEILMTINLNGEISMHINILPKEVVQHCSFRNVDDSRNLGNRPVSIYHQNSYFVPRLRGVKQNKSS